MRLISPEGRTFTWEPHTRERCSGVPIWHWSEPPVVLEPVVDDDGLVTYIAPTGGQE